MILLYPATILMYERVAVLKAILHFREQTSTAGTFSDTHAQKKILLIFSFSISDLKFIQLCKTSANSVFVEWKDTSNATPAGVSREKGKSYPKCAELDQASLRAKLSNLDFPLRDRPQAADFPGLPAKPSTLGDPSRSEPTRESQKSYVSFGKI